MLHILSSHDPILIDQLIACTAASDEVVVIEGAINNAAIEDLATSPAALYYLPASSHADDTTQKATSSTHLLKHATAITDDKFLALCEKHASIHTWY